MKLYRNLPTTTHANAGIAREWSVCRYFGIERQTHDSNAYDKDSDVVANGMNISVKASAFTLMSGSLCEGIEDFEGIWNLYATRVHSDHFAYITADYDCYMMNLKEFGEFVHKFCRTERESEKNGGQVKIRCRKETAKMLGWLKARAN